MSAPGFTRELMAIASSAHRPVTLTTDRIRLLADQADADPVGTAITRCDPEVIREPPIWCAS